MEHGPFINDFPIKTSIQFGAIPASHNSIKRSFYRSLLTTGQFHHDFVQDGSNIQNWLMDLNLCPKSETYTAMAIGFPHPTFQGIDQNLWGVVMVQSTFLSLLNSQNPTIHTRFGYVWGAIHIHNSTFATERATCKFPDGPRLSLFVQLLCCSKQRACTSKSACRMVKESNHKKKRHHGQKHETQYILETLL